MAFNKLLNDPFFTQNTTQASRFAAYAAGKRSENAFANIVYWYYDTLGLVAGTLVLIVAGGVLVKMTKIDEWLGLTEDCDCKKGAGAKTPQMPAKLRQNRR